MKGKVCIALLAAALCLPLVSGEGQAATVSGGTVPYVGTISSAYSGVSGSTTTSTFFTTPTAANGRFILTEFCASSANGVVLIGGVPVGQIATLPGGGCVSFVPGYALPPNTPLSCNTTSGTGLSCSISGVTENAIQAGGGGLGAGLGLLR